MFRATHLLLFMLLILGGYACHSSKQHNVLFDASQLSYEVTPEILMKEMGEKPDSAFNKLILGKLRYILLYYDKDSTEFRFAKNRLIEVIVHKPVSPFTAQTITLFGLPYHGPSQVDTTAFIKWDHVYDNFDVVNFYLVGSKIDNRSVRYNVYFRIKR